MIEKVRELLPNGYELVYLTRFGSELYGTNDITKSDLDLKGIYLVSEEDLILNRAIHHVTTTTGKKNERNTVGDLDIDLWSMHKFIKHLSEGDTGAIDMFFSMFSNKIAYQDGAMIEYLKLQKKVFLTKNVKAFTGYCLGQAQRYGIKGSRYGDLILIKEMLDCWWDVKDKTISHIAMEFTSAYNLELIDLKHCSFIEKDNKDYFSILGKLYQLTISVEEFKQRLEKQVDAYGDRAKAAMEGIDWKALSHAYRAIIQIVELLKTEHIVFPLVEAEKIKQVKYDSTKEDLPSVLDKISLLMDETENLVQLSKFPDEVVQSRIDKIILNIHNGTL